MVQNTFKNIKNIPIKIIDWIGSQTSLLVHTIFFAGMFCLPLFGFRFDSVFLVLTTVVSLEAIYLSIFIQMTINRNTQSLQEVEEDIDALQEEFKDLDEDVDEIQEDIDHIAKREEEERIGEKKLGRTLGKIEDELGKILEEVERLKQERKLRVQSRTVKVKK